MKRFYPLALLVCALCAGCTGDFLSEQAEEETGATSGPFDGTYVLVSQDSSDPYAEEEPALAALSQQVFSPLKVRGDVIRYGGLIEGEFRFVNSKLSGNVIKGDALWHEDVHDPGDMCEVKLKLKKNGSKLTLSFHEEGEDAAELVYKKKT